MLIRVEIPIDAPCIDALLRQTFQRDTEACLIRDLREEGLLTLSLVATDDEGQIVGYVAFSPVTVNGIDQQWVGLAPLAVAEEWREQGIAKQLVYDGLDTLNEFGYAAVVTSGCPALYRHLGFQRAADYGLTSGLPVSAENLLVHPLADNVLQMTHGEINYAPHFMAL